jgi:hypothetical protein
LQARYFELAAGFFGFIGLIKKVKNFFRLPQSTLMLKKRAMNNADLQDAIDFVNKLIDQYNKLVTTNQLERASKLLKFIEMYELLINIIIKQANIIAANHLLRISNEEVNRLEAEIRSYRRCLDFYGIKPGKHVFFPDNPSTSDYINQRKY